MGIIAVNFVVQPPDELHPEVENLSWEVFV
jgi:hypothetical protein